MKTRTNFFSLFTFALIASLMIGCQDTTEVIPESEISENPKFEDQTPTFTTAGAKLAPQVQLVTASELTIYLSIDLENTPEEELRSIVEGMSNEELIKAGNDYIVVNYLVNKGVYQNVSLSYQDGTNPSDYDLSSFSDAPDFLNENLVLTRPIITICGGWGFFCITIEF